MQPEKTQDALLKSMIENAKNTAYGRDHNFYKINSYEDFVKNVPIGDFQDHRPYVDRMIEGEENVLFPGKPLMYNVTSGTISQQ